MKRKNGNQLNRLVHGNHQIQSRKIHFILIFHLTHCLFFGYKYRMSIVSNFFKISMTLRALHNSLVEDYGIPYWGSYILFAFVTILFGAMLGLVRIIFLEKKLNLFNFQFFNIAYCWRH